jgi:type IV pilus assembly protein PilM
MPASTLALDIGTYSIKALAGKPGDKPSITRSVEAANSLGFSVPTDDAQTEKLAALIDSLLNDHKLPKTDIRLALPETVVSTKVISLPSLSDAELASAISWQAEQHIPIPPEELALEYQVLYRPPRSEKNVPMRVMLVGARKPVIERYVNVFMLLGIEPSILETQLIGVLRSLQFTSADPTTLVAHIGASTMQLAVMNQGELDFVYTHLSGGQLLTKSLEQAVNLDTEQAEQYKRSYGLDEAQFQGKVRAALLPSVSVLVTEMQKAIRFFTNQHPTQNVARVVLSGGGAQLPGLLEFVAAQLGTEVLMSAPLTTAQGELPAANQTAFAVVAGLMMRPSS